MQIERGLGFAAVMLLLAFGCAHAASLSVQMDSTVIPAREAVAMNLVFEGGEPSSGPVLPGIPGLTFKPAGTLRQFTSINGRVQNQYIMKFVVTADKEGAYNIPAIVAVVNNQQVASQPFQLRVGKSDQSGGLIKMNFPKTNLYAGETVVFTLELYAIAYQKGEPDLAVDGFTIGKMVASPHQIVTVDGRQMAQYVFKAFATANRPGTLRIGPAKFTVQIPTRKDWFGNVVEVRTFDVVADPVTVNALPLPTANVPPHFTGAVGVFGINVNASPTNIAVGDPVTVKVEVVGNASVDGIRIPDQVAWKDFKTYPPTSKMDAPDAMGVVNRKVFEQVVVPQNTEVREVPPFMFSFFDPQAQAYRTLSSKAFPLIVRPSNSGQVIQTPSEKATNSVDIVHIKPQLGLLAPAPVSLLKQPLFWGIQALPVMAWLALFVRRRRQELLASNPRLRRRLEADKAIATGLQELPKLAADPKNTQPFFAAVFRLLQERLGERLDLPSSAITESVIEEYLRPMQISPVLLKDVEELFLQCNQARYAPRSTAQELDKIIQKTRTVLDLLKDGGSEIQGISVKKNLGIVLIGIFGSGSLLAAPTTDFEAANRLYEQGSYTAAIAAYEAILKTGQSSSALLFNLGNAFFKSGQAGRAVACYRQAEVLAPRDPDIQANLQFARRAVSGKEEVGPRGLRRMLGRFSANEWATITAVAGWVWFALLAVSQWRREWIKILKPYLIGLGAVFLLIALSLCSVLCGYVTKENAVVISREVQVRLGPYEESKSAFSLPDGAELEVLNAKGDWIEVRDSATRAGWIKKEHVLLLAEQGR